MKCTHKHKVAWETDVYRVACLDCGDILLCDKAAPAAEPVAVAITAPPRAPVKKAMSKTGALVMRLLEDGKTYDEVAVVIGKRVPVVKMYETLSKKGDII